MTRFGMEVEGAERVAELMEKFREKAFELQELTQQLEAAAGSLRLSGTLKQEEETSVRGITVEITPETSP